LFFQAGDGIRDRNVTGVQTCALPIFGAGAQEFGAGEGARGVPAGGGRHLGEADGRVRAGRDLVLGGGAERIAGGTGGGSGSSRKIGRASCRERVESWEGKCAVSKKNR